MKFATGFQKVCSTIPKLRYFRTRLSAERQFIQTERLLAVHRKHEVWNGFKSICQKYIGMHHGFSVVTLVLCCLLRQVIAKSGVAIKSGPALFFQPRSNRLYHKPRLRSGSRWSTKLFKNIRRSQTILDRRNNELFWNTKRSTALNWRKIIWVDF